MRKLFIFLLSILMLSFMFGMQSKTAEALYPERPIKCIVPFDAGGGTDVMVRAVATYIKLPQPIVTINISGASGAVGMREAYNAAPDGYTIASHNPSTFVVQCLIGLLPENAAKEMMPIAAVAIDPCILAVRKGSEFNSWNKLVELARSQPGKVRIGGVGMNPKQFEVIRIFQEIGVDITYVPYDSAAKSRTAVLGGHIEAIAADVSEVASLINSGELTPLVVMSKTRSTCLSEVPTLTEMGIDADVAVLRTLWAPPETPTVAVQTLKKAFAEVCDNEEFRSLVRDKLFYDVAFIPSQEIANYVEQYYDKYRSLLDKVLSK